MEDCQIRVVGEERVVVLKNVDRIWVADLARAGFTRRTADVGGPALCKVAALTVVEARRFNAAFLEKARAKVEEEQKELEMEGVEFRSLRPLYARSANLARDLAATLDAIGDGSYYPNWVIVEGMDID